MRIVQLRRANERRVAVVDGGDLQLLEGPATDSVYALASEALDKQERLVDLVQRSAGGKTVSYNAVYEGASDWRLLPSFDHPTDPAHCLVSGTGLTHKASAENRSAMHSQAQPEITDSLRMYRLGLEGGNPPAGQIGVQPEWFYKGDGSVLRAHGEALNVPSYGEDGGEEPEVAGAYLISPADKPFRVGLMVGNEFSDHRMEKRNYLYLAPSKLRSCAIGPELIIGEVEFSDVPGVVTVFREGHVLWTKAVWTGEKNMCHSVRNLEHHHFKYAAHCRPGDVHIHFFGADAFSFGEGIALQQSDVMQVSFPFFGRPLQNALTISQKPESLVLVESV